jgi:hypothetical protein
MKDVMVKKQPIATETVELAEKLAVDMEELVEFALGMLSPIRLGSQEIEGEAKDALPEWPPLFAAVRERINRAGIAAAKIRVVLASVEL